MCLTAAAGYALYKSMKVGENSSYQKPRTMNSHISEDKITFYINVISLKRKKKHSFGL